MSRCGTSCPFSFTDRGEQTVKNIARPVHVYEVGASAVRVLGEVVVPALPQGYYSPALTAIAAIAALFAAVLWLALAQREGPSVRSPQAKAPRFSIVVLPFATLGGDMTNDYLANIITENVTTGLARSPSGRR